LHAREFTALYQFIHIRPRNTEKSSHFFRSIEKFLFSRNSLNTGQLSISHQSAARVVKSGQSPPILSRSLRLRHFDKRKVDGDVWAVAALRCLRFDPIIDPMQGVEFHDLPAWLVADPAMIFAEDVDVGGGFEFGGGI
jgi:hypothetical protein